MGFAIYHGSKGKASGGGVGHHIDRTKGMEHTYSHADPKRIHFNKNLIPNNKYSTVPLPQAIKQRIEEGYKGKRKIRNDSVKYLSHVLTGSHEDMKLIFKDQEKRNAWVQKNYNFISEEYGKENILRFTLHLDEKTPHLHAITVPLTNDGRLSAKEVYGNKQDLSDRQDRYAEQMKEFGLERGLKRTGIKHENAKDYYSRIERAQNNVNREIREPSKNILGVYKQDSVRGMQSALKSANLALLDLSEKYKREQIKAASKSKSEERALSILQESKKEFNRLAKNVKEFQEKTNDIFRDPEQMKIYHEKILLLDREKALEKSLEKDRKKGRGFSR